MASTHHFAVDRVFRLAGAPFGIAPHRCLLELDDRELVVRFGPWTVATPASNVVGASVTGPYRLAKVIGPPHLSFADHGLTFATNSRRGTCIHFGEPVTGLAPFGLTRHPALTVTVEDPWALAEQIERAVADDPTRPLDPVADGGDPDPR